MAALAVAFGEFHAEHVELAFDVAEDEIGPPRHDCILSLMLLWGAVAPRFQSIAAFNDCAHNGMWVQFQLSNSPVESTGANHDTRSRNQGGRRNHNGSG